MFLIAGQMICGRIDEVPGRCYVGTRFLHLYYVPLIPLSSWVIIAGTEKGAGFQGQQIPLSGKSILFGWGQAVLFVAGVMNSIAGGIQIANRPVNANFMDAEIKLILGILCLAVLVLFWIRPFRANPERANELLGRLELQPTTHTDNVEVSA